MAPELSTTRGALRLGDDGVIAVRRGDGVPAMAGDGVGADLVRLALSESPTGLPPSFRGEERALGVDMTNWSVVVDERWIVKVPLVWGGSERSVRQLERLAAAGSALSPRLVGLVPWSVPGRGEVSAALVTELLADATDGWTWAVDDVLHFLRADAGGPAGSSGSPHAERPADAGARPEWPAVLGRMTAELHRCLAADAESADRPTGDEPAVGSASTGPELRERIGRRLDAALAAVDGEVRARLDARLPQLRAIVAAAPERVGGAVFPIHGDLHVGQFLRATDADGRVRYAVVDFDGDPQHPERPGQGTGMVDVAAVDVAHLLVSVDLVGSVVQKRLGRRDARVLAWASDARAQLLAAYRAEAARPGTDEGAPAAVLLDERALPALEAEQFARELTYAHRYLPRWEYAPDGAITARYAPDAADPDTRAEEKEWTPPASETT
ncbi:hypothetical protein [Herbiconiux sp. YIM B11900]|uniref:hypothetical protein n=1 Tax=Herbiconiux sp. YIM B11900 TaxID=3404131 RepID=UPI003F84E2CF